jgi:hypothetical protein
MLIEQPSLNKDLELKLTRLYVALTMTRNVAKLGVEVNPDSMIKLLTVASDMLEEILENKDGETTSTDIDDESELLM